MLNEIAAEEWVDPLAPPAFTDVAEGLAHLDETEAAAIKEMEEEARHRMQLDQDDPTQQSYFLRLDRRTIVKTEEEYVRCQLQGVPMKVVPFSTAVHVLREQDAKKKRDAKNAKKKKAAKKARRRNR